MRAINVRTTVLVAISIIVLSGVLFLATPASAVLTTNWQCDATPKYWCTQVAYDKGSGTITVRDRYFKGAIDGGARKWRAEYYNDWYSDGTYWHNSRNHGPSQWRTNVNFQLYSYTDDNTMTRSCRYNYEYALCGVYKSALWGLL